MTHSLPPELEAFVKDAVAACKYPSEDALINAAVRLLKKRDDREEWLRKEIQAGLDQLERGEYTTYTSETLDDVFEKIKTECRQRLAARKGVGQ